MQKVKESLKREKAGWKVLDGKVGKAGSCDNNAEKQI